MKTKNKQTTEHTALTIEMLKVTLEMLKVTREMLVVELEKAKDSFPQLPGRKTKFSGKTITALKKENPRRKGSHGWESYNIILNNKGPMLFEDYQAAGGRNRDLQWDIDHGNSSVS